VACAHVLHVLHVCHIIVCTDHITPPLSSNNNMSSSSLTTAAQLWSHQQSSLAAHHRVVVVMAVVTCPIYATFCHIRTCTNTTTHATCYTPDLFYAHGTHTRTRNTRRTWHTLHVAHATRHMLIYGACRMCHLNTTRMPLVLTHTRTRACTNATHATCTRKRHIMSTTCRLLLATCTHRSSDTVHACSFCTYTCHIMPHPRAHDTHTTHAYGTCYARTCHLRTRTRTWHLHMHIRTCTRACHMASKKYTCHTSACHTSACYTSTRHMPT
jgi:hypothetical protein